MKSMTIHLPARIYGYLYLFFSIWIAYVVNFTANRAELIGLPLVVLTLPLSIFVAEKRTGWFASDANDGLFVLFCAAVVNFLVIELATRLFRDR